jgi:hypothetical protein
MRLLLLLLLVVAPLMDEYEARLSRLEGQVGGQRELLRALQTDAVRQRKLADAAQNEALAARLEPGGLTAQHGVRGGATDRIPALGSPLLARLREDSTLSGIAAGRTDPFDGYSNALADPTFDTLVSATIGLGYTAMGPEWEAKYVLNSGTVATTRTVDQWASRAASDAFLSSGTAEVALSFGVDASDMTVYLRNSTILTVNSKVTPSWIVAAIRAWAYDLDNVTATIYLEIVDGSEGVLATGDTEDLVNLLDLAEQSLLEAGYEGPVAAATYRMRVRIDVTKTAGAGGDAFIHLAEPMVSGSDDGSPPAFTPAVGSWYPGAPGYQLVAIPLAETNIAAGATTVLDVGDTAVSNTSIRMPWGGSVVGVSWRFNAAITAGTYDIDVLVNGSPVFSDNGNDAQAGSATQAPFVDRFVGDDTIGAQIVTGGGFTPDGTPDLVLFVWVLITYDGT